MGKIRIVFCSVLIVCFLKLFTSCDVEKEFSLTVDEGRNLKREITFKEFKDEIGYPKFSDKISVSSSSISRELDDFEVDTTLVKSLE